MAERVFLYDTTLRDGAQTQGVDFSVDDKLKIAAALDRLGFDYVEGGWPGANPTDDAFFARPPQLGTSKLAAFGMTRRSGRSAANDPGLQPHFQAGVPVITLVGKTWTRHVTEALGAELDENLAMIEESIAAARGHCQEAMFDAEHFFDGYAHDPAYALACLEAAHRGGADWLVLCDTNGGTLPHRIEAVVAAVRAALPDARLGIHTHDDAGCAVANSLAAVRAGCRQIQGTLNGLGERSGNANLVTLLPSLMLKEGYDCGIPEARLRELTAISRWFDSVLNRTSNDGAAYVGRNAFAHKGGLHASAVARSPSLYEHVPPETVGNSRDIVVSDQAGRANLTARLETIGCPAPKEAVGDLLVELKARESQGYAFEGAAASFEMLARRSLGQVPDYFSLIGFRVITERRFNAKGQKITVSEATVKVEVAGERHFRVAEADGPVDALDRALRAALVPTYPALEQMHLVDYRVRIINPDAGTAAVTRVVIDSRDDDGRTWSTVGVSANILDASFVALSDAVAYKLFLEGLRNAA
ncbi:MAG: citramalate synthase [Geminicoccaceae bacterium]|nr:MAG: citramalate synthase [Geminicoccaceae bacterium]